MLEKIVLITAGGHVSSFHAAMLEMYETLEKMSPGRFELCGADGGLSGFHNGMFIPIKIEDIDENRAGSMIGSDREHLDLDRAKQVIKDHNIYSVVMMGGDNHLSEAAKGFEAGLPFTLGIKSFDL